MESGLKFYTSYYLRGNHILARWFENGEEYVDKFDAGQVTLYTQNPTPAKSQYHDVYGNELYEVYFDDVRQAREFVDQYKTSQFCGTLYQERHWAAEKFGGQEACPFDESLIRICILDIEVESENGFSKPEDATERINAITLYSSEDQKYYVWGLGEFENTTGLPVEYRKFAEEADLLRDFVKQFDKISPHIVSGWYIDYFDIPYLVNRITKLLGDEVVRKLSPFRKVYEKKVYGFQQGFNEDQTMWEIMGVQSLDYLSVYKKFSGKPQESYSLEHISTVELGVGKKSYAEYGTLKNFYKQNYSGYVNYNIIDVQRVLQLDEKNKFLGQIMMMAYDAKSNYTDVFSMVKLWETSMYNFCLVEGIMTPMKRGDKINAGIAGGYVKKSVPALYKWLTTFDAESLYPHLILMFNISPEMYHDKIDFIVPYVIADEMRMPTTYNILESRFPPVEKDICTAANGAKFRTYKVGIIPRMVAKMFADRKKYKNMMLEVQKQLETETDPVKRKNLKNLEAQYDNKQKALKGALNSCYGVMAQPGFFWFDTYMAEAITLSGQAIIQKVAQVINAWMNKLLKTDDEYVALIDTDSVGVTFDKLVQRLKTDDKSKIVDFLDKLAKKEIKGLFDTNLTEFAHQLGCPANRINMKREVIADQVIISSKKHYVMNVLDKEGVRYKEPKQKVTGLEAVRSSTPKVAQNMMKQCYKVMFEKGEEGMQEFIQECINKYLSLPIEEIAMPRSVSDIAGYTDAQGKPKKGTPQQVKAAIAFNQQIEKLGLTNKYKKIVDGDKIKFVYLKIPNPFGTEVAGWSGNMPEDLEIAEYTDKYEHLNRAFLSAMENLVNPIGWSLEKRNNISEFFS